MLAFFYASFPCAIYEGKNAFVPEVKKHPEDGTVQHCDESTVLV